MSGLVTPRPESGSGSSMSGLVTPRPEPGSG